MILTTLQRIIADFHARPLPALTVRLLRAKTQAIRDREQTLTPCERGVMARVITGLLNKQIAAELGIEEGTVKVHRGRVMAKMGVQSVAELVGLASRLQKV